MLSDDQYKDIGKIVVHEIIHNRKVNRAISQSKYYGAIKHIIDRKPNVKKLTKWQKIKQYFTNQFKKV